MKNRYAPFALVILLCSSAFAEASRKEAVSSISAVTVYRDRASVTRQARVNLQPGVQEISFSNLPVSLFDNSVRVSGSGTASRIIDVRIETRQTDTVPEDRIRDLTGKLTQARDEMQELVDRLSTVAAERDFLLQIKAQSSDNISRDLKIQRPTVEDWQKVIQFLDQNLTKFSAETRTLTKDRSGLQEKIDALQRQIDAIGSRHHRAAKNVVVQMDAGKSGSVDLSLTYMVPGARWVPQYDVRAAAESKTVELLYAGMIQQSTGEDWHNVDVSLSTARPDLGGVKPELPPWYVSISEPVRMQKSNLGYRTDRMEAAGGLEQEVVVTASRVEAEVRTPLVAAEFHITVPATILSDNTPLRVVVTSAELAGDRSGTSVPKLAPYAYAKTVVKNSTEFPFLSGAMNVYAGNNFVASSYLQTVAPGETFDAYLGIDPLIHVERKLINKLTEYVGTFTRSVRVTYEFRFTAENNHTLPQLLAVQDQVPLSQNEKIIVTQIEPAEKEMKKDDLGMLVWNLTLAPSEKKTWKFVFSIEYPQGTPVAGLE